MSSTICFRNRETAESRVLNDALKRPDLPHTWLKAPA